MSTEKNHQYEHPYIDKHNRASSLFYMLFIPFICHGCSSEMGETTRVLEHTNGLSTQATAKQAELPNSTAVIEGPRILLENTRYDLGEVKPLVKTNATFTFRNTGDCTLLVTGVKSCCGVPVRVDKKELLPGETGILTAQYTAGQGAGVFTKRISLLTDDPQNPRVELTFTGKVVPTLAWSPARVALSTRRGGTACPDITIKSLDGTPFSVKGFASTGQCLSTEFDPSRKATEFTLKPAVDVEKVNTLATSSGRIRIDLDHRDYKRISLAFSITPALQVTPSQIIEFYAKAGEPLLRSLQIKDNQAAPDTTASVEIASVASNSGNRVELRGLTANKESCELKVAIWPAGSNEKESFSTDQLLIELKDGRKLSVPVRVFYASGAVSSKPNPDSNL
jgi:hypothetical protein